MIDLATTFGPELAAAVDAWLSDLDSEPSPELTLPADPFAADQ